MGLECSLVIAGRWTGQERQYSCADLLRHQGDKGLDDGAEHQQCTQREQGFKIYWGGEIDNSLWLNIRVIQKVKFEMMAKFLPGAKCISDISIPKIYEPYSFIAQSKNFVGRSYVAKYHALLWNSWASSLASWVMMCNGIEGLTKLGFCESLPGLLCPWIPSLNYSASFFLSSTQRRFIRRKKGETPTKQTSKQKIPKSASE